MPISTVPPKCPVDGFSGSWFDQKHQDYDIWAYQYASTSMKYTKMTPKLILVPKGDDDVKKAIAYAKKEGVQIAIRTGGHQYCGASSTDNNNIQLDMSEAYLDWSCDRGDANNPATVTTGVSHSLLEFNKRLAQNNLFAPTGQCSNVHLGGHIHTGGYGQLTRAFGLLGDHILSLTLFTANGEKKTITRNSSNAKDRDLFFAVLGGSPGNFGVLTHAKIQVYRDEDFPESRGLRAGYLYNKDRLARLLKIMINTGNRSRSYDMCISVVTADSHILPHYCFHTEYDEDKRREMCDDYFRRKYPDRYGTDGMLPFWPSMIVVYAQWANTGGNDEPYDDEVKDWFEEIKTAVGHDVGNIAFEMPDKFNVKPDKATPMSKLVGSWTFQNVREYILPFEKRTVVSNWEPSKLEKTGWVDWVAGRIDWVQSQASNIIEKNKTGCKLSVQIQNFGGAESMFYKNSLIKASDGKDITAFSWRDSKVVATLDVFYDETMNKEAHKIALDWHKENERTQVGVGLGSGKPNFCDVNPPRRLLWASWGDRNMGNVALNYFSQENYDRLVRLKNTFDPAPSVFTPNNFCVGAAKGPPELPSEEVDTVPKRIREKVHQALQTLTEVPRTLAAHVFNHVVDDKLTDRIKGRVQARLDRISRGGRATSPTSKRSLSPSPTRVDASPSKKVARSPSASPTKASPIKDKAAAQAGSRSSKRRRV